MMVLLVACRSTNYAALMQKKVQQALGNTGIYGNVKDYTWFAYPTNNFGLGTTFALDNSTDKPSEINQECATWRCIGMENAVPTLPEEVRKFGGYADVGGDGGTITLSETEKRDVALKVVLPEIYKVLDLGVGFKNSRTVKTTLSLGRVYPRTLARQKFVDYITALPPTDRRKAAYDRGLLAVAVADYMIDSMDVDIQLDTTRDVDLNAKLSQSLNQVVGKDAAVNVKVSGGTNGQYRLTVTKPVILATLIRKQPRGGVLGSEDDRRLWKDWDVTRLDIPTTKP